MRETEEVNERETRETVTESDFTTEGERVRERGDVIEREDVSFATVPAAKAEELRRKVSAQMRVRCEIDSCATSNR